MRTRIASMVLGLTALLGTTARADGMRCGTQLVSDGDSMYEVKTLCGTPDQAVQRMEQRSVDRWVDAPCNVAGQQGRCGYWVRDSYQVQVDEWLYDFGPHQLVRTVVFETGKLVQVKTGAYGVKQT